MLPMGFVDLTEVNLKCVFAGIFYTLADKVSQPALCHLSIMSDDILQRVKDLEGEVERLKAQLRARNGAGVNLEAMTEPGSNEKRDCQPEASTGSRRNKKGDKGRPFDFSAHPRRHVALRLAYLGWTYQGFAVQENTDNTVEARLFEALLKTRLIQDRQSSNYHRCGRTDKGVSAFSQVSSLCWTVNMNEDQR